MKRTPFPVKPLDVVALSVQEFTSVLDLCEAPPLEMVCGRFADDANRALVWLLRYRALSALNGQAEMAAWLNGGSRSRDVREVAATFALNDRWEFDRRAFCSAVDAVGQQRRP
jgi:hypothetical protein